MSFRKFSFTTRFSALCGAALLLVGSAFGADASAVSVSNDAASSDAKACEQGGYYVFSYFVGNGEDGLHYAVSRDGYKWTALNGGKSVFASPLGKNVKLMRDPSVCQGADGVYRLAWTVSWDGKSIGVASSRDLIEWTDVKVVPTMAHEPTARNSWAPEVFYDKKSQEFYIVWSTTIPGRFSPENEGTSEDRLDHRAYYVTTKDFQTFSPTKLYFEPGHNVIDGYLAEQDGEYFLFYKDETLRPEAKKTILVAKGKSPVGPFENPKTISAQNWVEGPSALRVDGAWLVFYDCYRDGKYGAVRSVDGENWEDVGDKVQFPKGTRHGTAFEVDRETFERLVERYGDK